MGSLFWFVIGGLIGFLAGYLMFAATLVSCDNDSWGAIVRKVEQARDSYQRSR